MRLLDVFVLELMILCNLANGGGVSVVLKCTNEQALGRGDNEPRSRVENESVVSPKFAFTDLRFVGCGHRCRRLLRSMSASGARSSLSRTNGRNKRYGICGKPILHKHCEIVQGVSDGIDNTETE